MTNEEIERAVDVVIDGDWHEWDEGDLNYTESVDEKKLAALLREEMRGLVVRAYTRAAGALCVMCKDGEAPTWTGRDWQHGAYVCKAVPVLALRNELVQKSASSSK